MDINKAIALAGTQSNLARILGVSRAVVHSWKKRKLPDMRVWELKVLKPEWFDEKPRF